VDFRSELVGLSDDHRAGLQPLSSLAIFPLIPKTSCGKKRQAIGGGEIPRLLPTRGVLPFVVSGHRASSVCA